MNLQTINDCVGTNYGLQSAGTDPGGCYKTCLDLQSHPTNI